MKYTTAAFAALIALVLTSVPAAHEPAAPTELPCEAISDSPTPTVPAPSPPKNLRIIKGLLEDVQQLFLSGPSAEAETGEELDSGALVQAAAAHSYFEALASRPDCARAFSLRSAAQIDEYRTKKTMSSHLFYDPAKDSDPRRQDAMKIVIPAANNSLATQLWVPTGHTPRTNLLVTFDAWWGKEYDFSHTRIPTHKSWQIGSPNADIWTEVQVRFGLAQSDPALIGWTDIRQYATGAHGPNTMFSPVFNGRNYGGNVIGPLVGEFAVKPEVWTRFWVFFDLQPDGQWYRMSMWVADETRNPVRIYEGLQITPRKGPTPIEPSMDGVWGMVRVEYNTSHSPIASGRLPLISYARNVVSLKGISLASVTSLLQRPVK